MGEETAKPSGRKRGRPRTVTDDQEVPERRRKQLRLAQQAYRKRKETTIGNLQNRVHELETGIENISHSFLSFSSLLIEEQLLSQYPHIASALQIITQQCVSLAKAGSEDPSEGALPVVRATKESQTTNNNIPPTRVLDGAHSEGSTDAEDIIRPAATGWPGPPTPPYQGQSISPFDLVMSSSTVQFPHTTPPLSNYSTLDPQSSNIMPARQWNIAQRIVRTCSELGYRLLIDKPNSSLVQHIFGSALSLQQRNRLISALYAVMQEDTGVLTDPKADVLHTLLSGHNMNPCSDEQLQISSRTWQIALESTSGEWMDAIGVQRYLRDKRAIFENFTDSLGPHGYSVSPSLDITAFIKSLSKEAICVGNGPAFRRQSVDKALRLATISGPWDLDNFCNL
ncbi:hypothetical protein E8E15_008700 [Penicillium rubens]|uniref:BZIP domain-containing protein n=1 Tax=Penicillium chrysogenum TaxID=5076 RepID=A0A162CR68_PENCH|nr:uncharacterized protein N7525_001429 [Penicillium rubens]KAF3025335.1 hypothetical protein E8E15_008700 [Penicillium rubens]KAJ5843688.1 hypothetical protein N7525_001429 [Penicillium rubens]KAJ5845725.1 hypothetical protein N7534_009394 [Penicillium rubens]KZN85330.1 hypothetical protein EN45_095070 [Penicillium chrysogenum]